MQHDEARPPLSTPGKRQHSRRAKPSTHNVTSRDHARRMFALALGASATASEDFPAPYVPVIVKARWRAPAYWRAMPCSTAATEAEQRTVGGHSALGGAKPRLARPIG